MTLGVLAWLAHVGWLYVSLGSEAPPAAGSIAPLLVLVAGAAAVRLWGSRVGLAAARVLLLGLYPAALVAVAASVPEATLEGVHSPASVLLCTVTLLAYCAGAAISCGYPLPAAREAKPIEGVLRARRSSARELGGVVFAVVWIVAALALLTAAPLSPAWPEVEHAWGKSAAAGAVLSAIAASALAVTSVAVFLGTLLRRADAEPPLSATNMRARVATLIFMALLSGAVYFTLVP